MVDGHLDRPELHDPNLFFDHGHDRQPIVRLLEREVAETLRRIAP